MIHSKALCCFRSFPSAFTAHSRILEMDPFAPGTWMSLSFHTFCFLAVVRFSKICTIVLTLYSCLWSSLPGIGAKSLSPWPWTGKLSRLKKLLYMGISRPTTGVCMSYPNPQFQCPALLISLKDKQWRASFINSGSVSWRGIGCSPCNWSMKASYPVTSSSSSSSSCW